MDWFAPEDALTDYCNNLGDSLDKIPNLYVRLG